MLLIITITAVTIFLNLSTSMTWSIQNRVLVTFSQFLAAAHISRVNCDEMARDRPGQPAHDIF